MEKLDNVGKIDRDKITEVSTNVPKRIPVSGQSPQYSADIGNKTITASYVFNFQTDDVFSTFNKIDYQIYLSVSDRSFIKDTVLIFGTPDQDFSKLSIPNTDLFVEERTKLFGDTIKLFPEEERPDYFFRVGNIKFNSERDLVLYFFLIDVNNVVGFLPPQQPVLSITSAGAKLQADTNRAILDQINEEKKSTIEQEKSNFIIEGLTWIALGSVFMVLGADVALRFYFERK